MKIAVVTPSIPTRHVELCRAIASVNQQSLPPDEHLIAVDYHGVGPAAIRNQLISSTDCDWIAFLDDDDRLYPNHLSTLAEYADRADVIIPYCQFDGPPLPRGYSNRKFSRRDLAAHGCFPITVLVRRELIDKAEGFWAGDRYEDWSMWNRMANLGAAFLVLPEITWVYYRGHSSRTGDPK